MVAIKCSSRRCPQESNSTDGNAGELFHIRIPLVPAEDAQGDCEGGGAPEGDQRDLGR
jgi:hypothetical protein